MNLIIILLFCVVGFGLYVVFPARAKSSINYMLAIGCIINGSIFNAFDYPFKVFGVPTGLDAVVNFLFVFTIVVMHAFYGKKQTYNLLATSIAAVLFAAFIQLLSTWASSGIDTALIKGMLRFVATTVASLVLGVVVCKLYDLLKAKKLNPQLNVLICLIVGTVIESVIFLGLLLLIGYVELNNAFYQVIGGLFIGKAIALIFAMASIICCHKFKKDEKLVYID